MATGPKQRNFHPLDSEKPYHGGDPKFAEAEFGRPDGGWLDLSTGINPFAYPVESMSLDGLCQLPTSTELEALLTAARDYYRLPVDARLIAAPGSQAVLQLLPYMRPPARVHVLAPTYEEYAHIWRTAGHEVREVTDWIALGAGEVAVICQPNNPDGRSLASADILELADRMADRNGLLVIDEAFADLDPGLSMLFAAGRPGLLILRSFGKFFGLAGLRLGFAAGQAEIIGDLGERLGPWAISSLAAEIGQRALSDEDWIAAMRARLAKAREELDNILIEAGLRIIGGTDLFRLVEDDQAQMLYAHLAKAGILVRPFPRFRGWLRIGLMGSVRDLARLRVALKSYRSGQRSKR